MTHHCGGCPECVELFDEDGYHGSVSDSHSVTCKGCPHRGERDHLYRITLDIVVGAKSKEEADDIARAFAETESARIHDGDIEVWSSGVEYRGIDTEGEE